MNIRQLNESDAKAYQQLRLAALKDSPSAFGSTYELESQYTIERMTERVRPTADRFVLGAFTSVGTLVGLVTFMRDSGQKTAHKAHVFGMYVAPVMRGHRLGKALLQELIRRARECEGVEQVHLTVVSGNEAAKRLYIALGFEVYGIEPNALKDNGAYWDEELMVLKL